MPLKYGIYVPMMEFHTSQCLLFLSTGLSTVFSEGGGGVGGKLTLFSDTLKTGGTVIYVVLLCVFTLSSGKVSQCIGCAAREYFNNLSK